jgi:hypothetical protein
MEVTTVTGTVTVLDIIGGDAPAILTQEETRFRGGKRLFTQKVPVRDAELFARLSIEVRKGDCIEATVVTEWHEDTSEIYLADFQRLPIPVLVQETVAAK